MGFNYISLRTVESSRKPILYIELTAESLKTMFYNYLIIAWRNLKRHKVFSLINILGLAIGMAACLLILQYVSFELSYDQFHKKADRIYRIRKDVWQNGMSLSKSATADPALAPAMKADVPGVAHATRIVHTGSTSSTPAFCKYLRLLFGKEMPRTLCINPSSLFYHGRWPKNILEKTRP
jgi:hypothetical protein